MFLFLLTCGITGALIQLGACERVLVCHTGWKRRHSVIKELSEVSAMVVLVAVVTCRVTEPMQRYHGVPRS